ncbi:MAG: hypothetical protein KGH61_04685 [Candidatus Micrarchaeota archaeon]|nr:hypothetical protein [Candidatus Micrarchaeota archaeon]MDE1848214.1 hypothetical protein [Candidatus Micrarchaeota archaeon]MDE1864862.1 hypothetical protein [Candidatus Micrarchaeota archaeon]
MAFNHQGERRRFVKDEMIELRRYFEKTTGLNPGIPQVEFSGPLADPRIKKFEFGLTPIGTERSLDPIILPKNLMTVQDVRSLLSLFYAKYALIESPLVLVGGPDFASLRRDSSSDCLHLIGYYSLEDDGYRKMIDLFHSNGKELAVRESITGGIAIPSYEVKDLYALSSISLLSKVIVSFSRVFAFGYASRDREIGYVDGIKGCIEQEGEGVVGDKESFLRVLNSIKNGTLIEMINKESMMKLYDKWGGHTDQFLPKLTSTLVSMALIHNSKEKDAAIGAMRALLPLVYTDTDGIIRGLKEIAESIVDPMQI